MFKCKKIPFFAAVVFLSLFLTSCGELGYSLVLWNNSQVGVCEGQTVKVFVKSNISHTYIIQIPETREKVEIPLWQISEPDKKSRTAKLAEKYSDYGHTYASVKLDGLPIRESPVNTAKQVYRLRKNEIIRVLFKGNGEIPNNGHGNLNGEWLRVLTEGGTSGWCFSYNLNLFERAGESLDSTLPADETSKENDEMLSEILLKRWYPEYYGEMIRTGRYDLNLFTAEYGLSFGTFKKIDAVQFEPANDDSSAVLSSETDLRSLLKGKPVDEILSQMENRTFTVKKEDLNKSWQYKEIKKADDSVYQFDDLQVTLTPRGKNTLVLQYMDSDGKMKSESFVSFDGDVKSIIEAETSRRQEELKSIAAGGPSYHSSNYGTIIFNNENSVTWKNYRLLVPSVVDSSALGSVTVTAENYISNKLKADFDGILTFHFMGMEKPVNFFYKKDSDGIRLEDATKAVRKGNYFTGRGSSPLVMYFSSK